MKSIRESIKNIILNKYNNYTIIEADSGKDCFNKFIEAWESNDPFDIIFLDIEMKTTGTAALYAIRESEKSEKLPKVRIVMVTSSTDFINRFLSHEYEADNYIIKNSDIETNILKEIEKINDKS